MAPKYSITKKTEGQRIDAFCTKHSELSRTKIHDMLDQGLITINGIAVKAKTKVKSGDVVFIGEFVPEATQIEALEVPLTILFEDEHLLVIHKQKGLTVHPGKNTFEPTLLNGLVKHFQELGLTHTPGLVHRIDKDTEGLLVVAKNSVIHNALALQLEDKSLYRNYVAFTEYPVPFQTLDVDAAIGMDKFEPTRQAINGIDARPAQTTFKNMGAKDGITLLHCTLKTGRTHQIRVHAKHSGFPLIGDSVYGDYISTNGQALCAYELSFVHPKTKERMHFTTTYDATYEYAKQLKKHK